MCRKIKTLCVAYLMLLTLTKTFEFEVSNSKVITAYGVKDDFEDPQRHGKNFLNLQMLSSKCCVHVYIDSKEVLNLETKKNVFVENETSTNGLHLVAVNPKSGFVFMKRLFFTEVYAEDVGIPVVLEALRNGEIVVLAVKSDAALNLGVNIRRLFRSLGSVEVHFSSPRTYFVWVFANGGKTFVESVNDDQPLLAGNYWSSPLYVDVTIPIDVGPNCWSGTGNAKDRKREEFCNKYGGYADLCNCNSPLDINFNVPELKENDIRNVPILIVAGNRPQSLVKCLLTILNQPGGHKENIIVVIDGVHQEVNELLDILEIRYFIHSNIGKDVISGSRISLHYLYALNVTLHTFSTSEFVIVLEEDLLVAPDFVSFFSQTAKVLASDESLYCINAWNDLSAMHAGGNPHRIIRQETQPSYGWMIQREMSEEAIKIWPRQTKDFDWDMWFRGPSVKSSRECLVPEIPRSFHLGMSGVHIKGQFTYAHFTGHLTTGSKLVQLENLDRLTEADYEEDLFDLLSSDDVFFIKTDLHPCSPYFIPRNFTDKGVVVFFWMENVLDETAWYRLASCLGLFNMDTRNHHRGMFQIYFYSTRIFAIGYPFSDYSFFKPSFVNPVTGEQSNWDKQNLQALTVMNRRRFVVPRMESLLPFELSHQKATPFPIFLHLQKSNNSSKTKKL